MISVIVPTFNEEQNIGELIRHIRNCDKGEKVEIIVCDAPLSSDDGFRKAGELGAKAVKSPSASRAIQMNYGAEKASNEILYFLHADARPPKDFIIQIMTALQEVDFGIFSYKFNSTSIMLKINALTTRYDGLFAGAGDQSLFISRQNFEDIGSFDSDLLIMEDFEFYRRAKKAGLKFKIVKEPLLISARKYEQNSWFKVNVINLQIYLLYLINGSQERMIALNQRLKSTQKSIIRPTDQTE